MALVFLSLQPYSDPSFQHAMGPPYATGLPLADVAHHGQGAGLSFYVRLSDGTGPGETEAVDAAVARLRNLVFSGPGQQLGPKYVLVTWGPHAFPGCLTSFNVSYSQFRPDGVPLAATVELFFHRASSVA